MTKLINRMTSSDPAHRSDINELISMFEHDINEYLSIPFESSSDIEDDEHINDSSSQADSSYSSSKLSGQSFFSRKCQSSNLKNLDNYCFVASL